MLVGSGVLAAIGPSRVLGLAAIASRAFAFYYLTQCSVAPSVTRMLPRRSGLIMAACALGFISVFAVPAS